MTLENKKKAISAGTHTFLWNHRQQYFVCRQDNEHLQIIKRTRKKIFLSHPGRFGKSLFVKTSEELFSGKRESFKGLYIDKSGYNFPYHPVINFSLIYKSSTIVF
jgi:hypothetical protein